jgi:hypothetical protein
MQRWKFFLANSFTLYCSARSRVVLEEDQHFPNDFGFIFVTAT